MKRRRDNCFHRILIVLIANAVGTLLVPPLAAAFIVENGEPRAEIVIAENASPPVKVAAEELRNHVKKMSGAELPVVTKPTGDGTKRIFVGKSSFTDELGIAAEHLRHGAYRMVSGEDWLALIGRDRSFTPREPYLHNGRDQERLYEEWDRLTGGRWGFPYAQLWKQRDRETGMWSKDERGSLNAVCGFLRRLGVRWYFPNEELGTIVPEKKTITLPKIDEIVEPDFAIRYPYQYGKRFGGAPQDEVMWQLRMGFNQAPDVMGLGYPAHGTARVIAREETRRDHPEYYALIGGKRAVGEGKRPPCLSSPGLLAQNVRYVRKLYDIYDVPMVSVMPTDGFTATCECALCAGKKTPERGWKGQFSDYVWNYVDAVAREVRKTHPDRKVVGMAYTTYMLPPETIDKFSPNLVVCVAQGRCGFGTNPEAQDDVRKLRRDYLKKLPEGEKALMEYEYYRYAVPGKPWRFLPVFAPHAIADDLKSLKDISLGDFMEVHRDGGDSYERDSIAVTHLNLYVTGRGWWDADLDVDALLDEYYELFYGPAADEMKAFIEFCEENWLKTRSDADAIDECFRLLEAAKGKAPEGALPAKRINVIASYLEPLKALRAQIAKKREDVPLIRMVNRERSDLTLDGVTDDVFWSVPGQSSGSLRENWTGRVPAFPTKFKTAWGENAVCFRITCVEPDMENLNTPTAQNDDPAILAGDCVEILLETQGHSHYHVAVSPNGAVLDQDRKDGDEPNWTSNVEVAVHRGDGEWSAEVLIPVAGDMQEEIDPLSGVSGRKPTSTFPWYFNVCRQRVRNGHVERQAFSPTGREDPRLPDRFAKLHMKL